MTVRTETQIAIRMRDSDGKFQYKTKTADFEGTRFAGPARPIGSVKEAQTLLKMYSKDVEPTIVTRKVTVNEGVWEEVETSEVKLLAEILHGRQCHLNHCQCGWNYKESNTRAVFEEKAKKILEKTNFESAKELIELFS